MNPAHEQIGREESDPQITQISADSKTENNGEKTTTNDSNEHESVGELRPPPVSRRVKLTSDEFGI